MISVLNRLPQLNGNKMKIFGTLLLVFFTFCSFGQKYADIGEKNGKKYYLHEVQKSQSLYQIAKTYEVSIDELKENNTILDKGLQIGQILWIPAQYDEIIHIVQVRETLYGISRRYSKPIDSILSHNPKAREGLIKGQELIIKNIIRPFKLEDEIENPFSTSIDFSDRSAERQLTDSIAEYTVHPGETLYSISRRFMVPMDTLKKRNNLVNHKLSEGQILIIPLKKELEIKERVPMDSIVFDDSILSVDSTVLTESKLITVFLPFNLDTIDTKNVRSYALEYYMGALMAIDSLKHYGVNADFHFIDYESVIKPFDSSLTSENLLKSDLIFAPFNFEKSSKLKKWSEDKSVKVIYPLKALNKLNNNRENDYFMEPNLLGEYYTLSQHLSGLDSVQLVFIRTADSIEQSEQNKFLEVFYNLDNPSKIIEANADNYSYFSKKKDLSTVYILLSNNCDLIEELLSFSTKKENVLIYGKISWPKECKFVTSMQNTKAYRYFNGSFLNYNDARIKKTHRVYRRQFNSDLTRMGGIGFDATLNMVLSSLYNISLPQGLVYRFRYNFEGYSTNYNTGGYIMSFDNLNISIID